MALSEASKAVVQAVLRKLSPLGWRSSSELEEAAGGNWVHGLFELRKFGYDLAREGENFRLNSLSPKLGTPTAVEIRTLFEGLTTKFKTDSEPPEEEIENVEGEEDEPEAESEIIEQDDVSEGAFLPAGEGTINLAEGLCMPPEAVTQTFGLLAKRGAGKTHTAKVMAEDMIASGYGVVILDPTGAWWGMRSSFDGKTAGVEVPVLGGDHGTMLLSPESGEKFADAVVSGLLRSVIFDLSGMVPPEQAKFVCDFCSRLYHTNREARHIFLDEADEFVPQMVTAQLRPTFLAVDRVVRRGRIKGLGITLVSQRSAVIHKNVLSQVEVLLVLRTVAPPDLNAVESWLERNVTGTRRDEIVRSLPRMPTGDAWFLAPGWLGGILRRISVRQLRTWNSSATPEVNEALIEPEVSWQPDLAELAEFLNEGAARGELPDLESNLRESVTALRRALSSTEQVLERVETYLGVQEP